MRKFLSGFMLLASLSLVLMVPAFAETTTSKTNADLTPLSGQTGINKTYYPSSTNGTLNGLTTNGITGTTGTTGTAGTTGTTNGYYYNRLNGSQTGTGLGTGVGTGTYNTDGTYRPYSTYGTHGNYGTYDSTRMNAYRPYSTTNLTTRANHNVRAMETTTRRGFSWGWLGLLGLFGLAGMRSRSRDEVR